MRNDAVVKALENLTGCKVSRCDVPELMGAYGCALYAKEKAEAGEILHCLPVRLPEMTSRAKYTASTLNCKGCDNNCLVVRYRFGEGRDYYSGNRCERVFSNGTGSLNPGGNVYTEKLGLLFGRVIGSAAGGRLRIGIPR